MRTIVHTNCKDTRYDDWKKGEKGYIDGYIRGGDNTPLAVVVIKERIVMIPLHCLDAKGIVKEI